jgi:hypothetical protein
MMLAAVAFLLAADDPGGWSKAKWGMTEAQLSAAFGADFHEVPDLHGATDYLGRFRFSLWVDLTVGKIPCRATPHFDKDGHLDSVSITPNKFEDETVVLSLNLRDLLVQKYGPPSKSTEDMDQWTFPTTLITLQHIKILPSENFQLDDLSLTYEKIAPASNPL